MEGEEITKLLGGLRETADFLLSAFAVFYFQHPSMLDFQMAMEVREKRNNPRALFGAGNILGTDPARNILDSIDPKELFPAFDRTLETALAGGVLEDCRVPEGTIPGIRGTITRLYARCGAAVHTWVYPKRGRARQTGL